MSSSICIVNTLWKTLKPGTYLSITALARIFILKAILKMYLVNVISGAIKI